MKLTIQEKLKLQLSLVLINAFFIAQFFNYRVVLIILWALALIIGIILFLRSKKQTWSKISQEEFIVLILSTLTVVWVELNQFGLLPLNYYPHTLVAFVCGVSLGAIGVKNKDQNITILGFAYIMMGILLHLLPIPIFLAAFIIIAPLIYKTIWKIIEAKIFADQNSYNEPVLRDPNPYQQQNYSQVQNVIASSVPNQPRPQQVQPVQPMSLQSQPLVVNQQRDLVMPRKDILPQNQTQIVQQNNSKLVVPKNELLVENEKPKENGNPI